MIKWCCENSFTSSSFSSPSPLILNTKQDLCIVYFSLYLKNVRYNLKDYFGNRWNLLLKRFEQRWNVFFPDENRFYRFYVKPNANEWIIFNFLTPQLGSRRCSFCLLFNNKRSCFLQMEMFAKLFNLLSWICVSSL